MPAPGQNADRVDRARSRARGGQGAPSRLGKDDSGDVSPGTGGGGGYIDREMGNQNYGTQGDLEGGFGQTGYGRFYNGSKDSLASRSQLNVDFDLDNLGWGDLAKAVGGLALGANPLGIALGGLASLAGLSLGDFDFSSGVPGDPQGKGPGGSGTGGGPGTDRKLQASGLSPFVSSPTAAAAEPASPQALRQSADIQNYLSDLQRIALGQSDSRAALDRFGVAPEQAMFNYRESFPEFGDSMSNLSLAEIIKNLGNQSPNPAPFADGGRVGDERVRPRPDSTDASISTDLSRFTQMLKDLMMMPSGAVDSQGSENPFGAPDKPQARRPLIPGGLIPSQTGSPRHGGDAEAFRIKRQFRDDSPLDIIPEGARPEIEVEPLAPPVAPAESTPTEDFVQPYRFSMRNYETDSEMRLSMRELTAFDILTREGLSGRAAMDRVKGMTPEQLDLMVEVANSSNGFKNGGNTQRPSPGLLQDNPQRTATVEEVIKDLMGSLGLSRDEALKHLQDRYKNGGETRRPSPGLLQDNPQRTATVEEVIRDKMESRGLTQEEAVQELQAMFRKTYPMSETVPDYSFAGGGSVRGRRDALPMIEGDHVVPAHAVKGNEGGLAALSKKLMGNKNYDGMIRGPGGPREDAIKTRVYAAGGGISGKMDNLQNPFNSVPARVSDKEYVIPRQAITNLGMMNGAREGDANKAGQDIIYQLVENLKRKA